MHNMLRRDVQISALCEGRRHSAVCRRSPLALAWACNALSGTWSSPMEPCSAAERRDPAKHLKTHRALYSADRRYTALPAGVTCLLLADAVGIVLSLRTFLRLRSGR